MMGNVISVTLTVALKLGSDKLGITETTALLGFSHNNHIINTDCCKKKKKTKSGIYSIWLEVPW